MDLLQRLAENRGRLLRVERLGAALSDPGAAAAFLLTFDLERLLISADATGGRIDLMRIPGPEDVPTGLVAADEDEPWWRLLGHPVTKHLPPESQDEARAADIVRLQFREDDDDPRIVTLAREGGAVTVRIT